MKHSPGARPHIFPKGIITVLNTPFDEADRIDLDALQKHVDYAVASGVAGFLVPAMASEVYALSRQERKEMVRAVQEVCPRNCMVIGGAGENDVKQRSEVINDLLEIGCRHILLQIPYADATAFRREFGMCHSMGMEAIMLQDWDNTGGGLPLDLIVELHDEFEKFSALKVETVPAGPKYSRILERTGGTLHVSGGWTVMQMIEALDRGVQAFMPTAMHEVYVTIYNRYQAGNRQGAVNLFERLLPIIAFSNQHLDISIQFFKSMLATLGIYPTERVRAVSIRFDPVYKSCSEKMIQKYLRLGEDLAQGTI